MFLSSIWVAQQVFNEPPEILSSPESGETLAWQCTPRPGWGLSSVFPCMASVAFWHAGVWIRVSGWVFCFSLFFYVLRRSRNLNFTPFSFTKIRTPRNGVCCHWEVEVQGPLSLTAEQIEDEIFCGAVHVCDWTYTDFKCEFQFPMWLDKSHLCMMRWPDWWSTSITLGRSLPILKRNNKIKQIKMRSDNLVNFRWVQNVLFWRKYFLSQIYAHLPEAPTNTSKGKKENYRSRKDILT